MDFIKSLFTRKKPLSSNVRRNNTARSNYEFSEFEGIGNTTFVNSNPALQNLKIKRATNSFNTYLRTNFVQLQDLYKQLQENPRVANTQVLFNAVRQRNNAVKVIKNLEKTGKSYPNELAVLESLKFEELPVEFNAVGLNNSASVATNDPRKISGASNISGGRRCFCRKTRRNRKSRNRRRRNN